ncbi:UDP-glucose 4-epimerase GalE [Octadecabacter sp. 1_MG-2023]|uniref:UDP-glucose 4-epimerase GalE n=1 Tax=unclassified Octadecabacter TaxID=196158 RepID=UPI001C07F47B|nr:MULTISPECIES: UDP-glucose 4-epimerase GalE [unclassified Octadecabacter]MBU2994058.1 UDP-glucose 4-epimerase GalE [Octadecabacter sp. B2R22]MDO6736088.1 UDP-glucose 4-epimerase GalE [Octadecabacter sp. 1_MG-2023]
MKILITGGAGYVGSACLRYVAAQGHEVMAYDNLVMGHREAVDDHPLVVGDIADTALLTKTLKDFGADAVMHFAAATYVGESVEDPEYHYRNNVGGTLSLLNAMRAADVKRLLFSSTCATYGMTESETMSETTPQDPFSPYARTKLAVEWMIRDFAEAYGMGFTLLRYFNASGADPDGRHGEDHRPENHLIPLVLEVPLGQRDKIMVFGDDYPTPDGTCIRDYVHTQDLASAHLLAIMATDVTTREVFNIGTGNGQSVMQIIEACEKVTGQTIAREIVERRPGDPPRLVAKPDKLKTQLGWEPQYSDIEKTIQTAWSWHKANPNGYGGD